MAEERQGGVGGGLRTGVGILVAFKEAIEETIEEVRERGDFTPERARGLVQEATNRVQHSVEGARERLDFVSRKEIDELRAEVALLRSRIEQLEGSAPAGGVDSGPSADFPID